MFKFVQKIRRDSWARKVIVLGEQEKVYSVYASFVSYDDELREYWSSKAKETKNQRMKYLQKLKETVPNV